MHFTGSRGAAIPHTRPWVVLQRFEGQQCPFSHHVDVKDFRRDPSTDRDDVGGMVDGAPGQFGNVDLVIR
ncbi:hypothetical protein GCM10010430_68400 [Kitasatospora cystarginea]|uniref:Uncharacterized protein n=1 Tax=Kitasatospora cystarginea TaxID=58350 RepID=A0ABP5RRT9_9ACTN